MRINKKYVLLTIVLFMVEVTIALFVNDRIIRPFIGDVLAVILIYTFLRSFTDKWPHLPWYILIFAVIVEFSQLLPLVEFIGLGEYRAARILLGTTFDVMDIVAYVTGMGIVYFIEQRKQK